VSTSPPAWDDSQLEADRQLAIAQFRRSRMEEPLEVYLEAFEQVMTSMDTLLETTVDLTELRSMASQVLADTDLLEAIRYLPGPPISSDDLKVLTEASLAPSRLSADTEMAQRVIDTVLLGLDRARFPWVTEEREPTDAERETARIATAVLIAQRRVLTSRQNESKEAQEQEVARVLIDDSNFLQVPTRDITNITEAPSPGEFCGEAMLGSRKADLIVRLLDGRIMPIECKVSNSSTNSVKRLNNDAAVKANIWLREFGVVNIVPAAVLAGVYKRHNLRTAQDAGLTLWWAHSLHQLTAFIHAGAAHRGGKAIWQR
jgi:hypothetical protein